MSGDDESDRPSSSERSAEASQGTDGSRPPPRGAVRAEVGALLRKSRAPSIELMAAGEPDGEDASADAETGAGGGRGKDEIVVVARLSAAGAGMADGGMDEALRRSGVGLMKTTVRYSAKSAAANMRKSRGRDGSRASSLSATKAASALGKAPEVIEVEAGQMVGSRSRGRDRATLSVLESTAALKNGRKGRPPTGVAASAPASLDVGLDRQEMTAPDIETKFSADEEGIKPGAMAIFPSDGAPSECDAESASWGDGDEQGREEEQGLWNGGEIMAEAHLVEEDDIRVHTEITVEHGDAGQTPHDKDGADDIPSGVALATAKRMSPFVRFAQDHCLLVAALALLIVGGMAGMGAYLATRNTAVPCEGDACDGALGGGGGGGNGATTHRPTAAPTLSSAPSSSAAPSGVPSEIPTAAPTMPCGMTPEDRALAVSEIVAALVPDPLALEDAESPRFHARKWISEEDALDPPLCPDRDGPRLRQRFGLALLHYALGGEGGAGSGGRGWTYKSFEYRFLHDNHECDWAGVDCNFDTKKVNEINLGGRNLRGTLPAELFTIFEDLRVLNLQVNRINGCLPDEVSMASSLEFLYLSDNEFACELPKSLPSLLRELEMLDNEFTGPIPGAMLPGLESLQKLILGKNQLTGAVPSEIESLKELQTLHLDRNAMNSSLPPELFHLPNLVSLRLNGNSFESTLSSSVARLHRLEELYVHDNDFSGSIPAELFSLGAIKTMTLSKNFFSGALAEDVGAATTLEVLRLDRNRLTGTLPSTISQLKKLEILTIQWNRFGGFIADEICALHLKVDFVEEYSGSLRRLSATCDEGGGDGVDCNCCDCVVPESGAGIWFPPCYPYGGEEGLVDAPVANNEVVDLPLSRSDEIIELIIQRDVSDESALMQPSSPQGRALFWVAHEDEFELASLDDLLLQRYAMAVLYFSTKGDNWAQCSASGDSPCDDRAAFLSNSSVCEWGGISCHSSSGDIGSIKLEFNGLEGTIPIKELSGLCLNSLSFRGNTGISIDLGSEHSAALFSGLFGLDLSECDLVGRLNKYLFYPLFYVSLNDNRLNGTFPSGIGYSSLYALTLQYNEISGTIPVELGRMTGSELRLDNNLLDGTIPPSFGSLDNLRLLTLHNNELTGTVPDALCDLTFDYGGKLEDLWADCAEGYEAEIECSCCSQCL